MCVYLNKLILRGHLSLWPPRMVAASPCLTLFLFVVSGKTYVVDLSQERAMLLTIEPRPVRHGRRFVPGCFVCLESRTCSTNVTLTAGSKHKISFLCDDLTRLWVNVEKTLSMPLPEPCPHLYPEALPSLYQPLQREKRILFSRGGRCVRVRAHAHAEGWRTT